MLGSELVQGRLERLLTDLVCLEKLRGVVDHCRFSRAHSWEGAALPQRVNQGIVYPGSASGRRMRVPDIGAVHRSGGGDNGQFLDVLGKSGLVPQVMGYMVASTSHLRAVDGNRPRAGGDCSATFSGHLVERLTKLFWDLITRDYG